MNNDLKLHTIKEHDRYNSIDYSGIAKNKIVEPATVSLLTLRFSNYKRTLQECRESAFSIICVNLAYKDMTKEAIDYYCATVGQQIYEKEHSKISLEEVKQHLNKKKVK